MHPVTASSVPLNLLPLAANTEYSRIYSSEETLVRLNKSELKGLNIVLETKRLYLTTINRVSLQTLTELFGDERVMRFYLSGGAKSPEHAEMRIATWEKRARQGDPYHGLLVSRKEDSAPLGVTVMGYSEEPGVAELAQTFFQAHWNRGYGTEVAQVVTQSLAPVLRAEGYCLQGRPLVEVVATAHSENIGSQKCLLKAGFQRSQNVEKFESSRHQYRYRVSDFENGFVKQTSTDPTMQLKENNESQTAA